MTRTRALVVDDHGVNRVLIARQLEALGFDVDVAADGVEALTRFRRTCYDLVVLDGAMPGMDGCDVARRMRDVEARSSRASAFLVACTAASCADVERRCLAAGMDACVPKPGSTRAFASCLALRPGWDALSGPAETRSMSSGVAAEPDADAPIDLDAIATSFGTDAPGALGMLRDFVAVNAEDLQSLYAAIDDRDQRAVARHAHRMLGASKMVDAATLARVAGRLEALAATGDWCRIEALASVLVAECRRIERFDADAPGGLARRGAEPRTQSTIV